MSVGAPGPTARITGRLKGVLNVIAHQARDLQSKQMLGTMDPYAVLKVRSESIRSNVHQDGGRTPKWEHHFVFNLDCDEHEVLHIKVMNKELLSDDTIGLASVAMKDLVIYHQVRRWYQLVDKNNYTKIAGAIEMTVDYQGTGIEYVVKVPQPTATTTPSPMPTQSSSISSTSYPPNPSPTSFSTPSSMQPMSSTPTPSYYPPINAPAAAPVPAPAPAPYYAPPSAAPVPYGYQQPMYAPPPTGYYPPPAAPYGYPPQPQPQPQPVYYAPPPVAQPQVIYTAPPQPTVIYQQPQPEVVIIEERPFW